MAFENVPASVPSVFGRLRSALRCADEWKAVQISAGDLLGRDQVPVSPQTGKVRLAQINFDGYPVHVGPEIFSLVSISTVTRFNQGY